MTEIVKREIFDKILKHIDKKEITVIVGPRQTGKTTLLLYLKDYLISKKQIKSQQIKFFNLDLISDLENIKDQTEFIQYLKEELKSIKPLFVFIDEIQRLENAGKFLKGIYDLNLPVKFIVSGSSSLELKAKIFEPLTGRKLTFYLYPFSFSEYLSAKDPHLKELLSEKKISTINQKKLLSHLYDFIIFGGYPRLIFAENKEEQLQILNEIYSSYIERDIIGFLKIKQPITFSKLITVLAHQVGNLINFYEISNTLGINFRTLEKYLNILENTFIIKLVRPYFTNVRKELTKMPKVYFIDNGLMNFAIRNFTKFEDNPNKGRLLENFVFSSLLKSFNGSINFWRTKTKNEVDFILKDYEGNLIPLEVKSGYLKKENLPRGLISFIDKYQPKKAFIINLNLESEIVYKKTKIKFILPFRDLALD